jgi:hypothetical protein
VTYPFGGFPSVESMLCALVLKGNERQAPPTLAAVAVDDLESADRSTDTALAAPSGSILVVLLLGMLSVVGFCAP